MNTHLNIPITKTISIWRFNHRLPPPSLCNSEPPANHIFAFSSTARLKNYLLSCINAYSEFIWWRKIPMVVMATVQQILTLCNLAASALPLDGMFIDFFSLWIRCCHGVTIYRIPSKSTLLCIRIVATVWDLSRRKDPETPPCNFEPWSGDTWVATLRNLYT